MTKTIGEKILELRKQHSLTQEKLGEQLGVSSQAVSKWENGESMPDILLLPKLCEIFGISIDSLLEVQHSMKKENVMKSFFDYAKEVGSHNALMEAFIVSKNVPMQVSYNNAIDLSRFPDDPNTSYVKTSSKHIEVINVSGMGFVISNNEFMDKIRDFDVKKLMKFFEVFTNEEIMTVVKELLHAGELTKDKIIEKTNHSLETINEVLLILIERGICSYYHNKLINEDLYTVNIGATSFHMALTAYFIAHADNRHHYISR